MTTALTPEQMTNAILALSGIIALNIIATVAHHITDPDKLREQAEEEAFSKVEDATLKQISTNADTLAAQLAPTLAADWMNQTKARYMAFIGTGKIPTIDATAQDVTPPAFMPLVIPQAQPKAQPKASPFNLSALWAGLFNAAAGKGRTFESVTVAPAVVPDTKPQEKPTEAPTADPSFTNPAPNQ